LLPILQNLKNPSVDLKIRISLARAVKYGAKNNLDLRHEDLLQALEGSCAVIKSEIIWALGYKIERSDQELSPEFINGIKAKMTEDIDPKAKFFLEGQIAKDGGEINGEIEQENPTNTRILNQKSKRKAQVIVTKTQQVTSVSNRNTESQESQFEIKSITSAVRNQKRKIKVNDKVEKLPEEIKESQGTHVARHKGTYINAKNLCNRAKNGEIIIDQDKDSYLTNKFFNGSKYFTPGFLGDLITDRIIAVTFKIISKKQKLADNIIEKLMLCLNDSKSVCENYYLDQDLGTFLKGLLEVKIAQTSNDIRKKILEEIQGITLSKSSDIEKMEKAKGFFFKEVDYIRRDAISAFYNCALRDKKVLKAEYLEKMSRCLEDQDKEIRAFAVKILGTLNDNSKIDYKKVFNTCLKHLEENMELEQSMNYIDQQSKDSRRCEELFTKLVIFRLSYLLKKPVYSHEFKIDCNEIIQNYLENEKTGALALETLENTCWILQDGKEKEEVKEAALISLL